MVTIEKFDQLKHDIENMKHSSLIDNNYPSNANINKRRGACLQNSFEYDSGPIGLQYVPLKGQLPPSAVERKTRSTKTVRNDSSFIKSDEDDFVSFMHKHDNATSVSVHVEANTSVSAGATESSCHAKQGDSVRVNEMAQRTKRVEVSTAILKKPGKLDALASRACTLVGTPPPLPAPIATDGGVTRHANSTSVVNKQDKVDVCNGMFTHNLRENQVSVNNDSEWQVVRSKSSKRYKLIGQKGCASTTPEGKFRAADIKVPLLISNVSNETSESDIINYIKDKLNESVSLKAINMKKPKKYNAFKLYVSRSKLDLFLDDQFWPNGITFRRFVHFMYKTSGSPKVTVN